MNYNYLSNKQKREIKRKKDEQKNIEFDEFKKRLAEDYIELYGEDTYEKMYLIPNYWVMPEDESNDADENKNNSDNESLYDDDCYSDYSY